MSRFSKIFAAAAITILMVAAAVKFFDRVPQKGTKTNSQPEPAETIFDGSSAGGDVLNESGRDVAENQIPTPNVGVSDTRISQGQRIEETKSQAWDGVTTFAELQVALKESSPAERLAALGQAARACEARAHLSLSKEEHEAPDTIREHYFETFCLSYDGELGSIDQQLLALPATNELIQAQALFGIDDKPESKAAAVATAERIVLTSDGPAAFKAAGQYLVATERWNVGSELTESSEQARHLQEARYLAVEMLGCRLSGACGPNEWWTMVLCGHAQRCTPYVSADDIWRYTHSPMVYELAVRIELELLAHRAEYE